MSTKHIRILCLSIMLFALTLATLWFRFMEVYYESVDADWSINALRNPYHAAQQYLQQTGTDVYTTQKLSNIQNISTNKTLFISHAGQVVSHKQVEHLLTWMRAGGHIITAAQHNEDNDPLLSRFSIEKISVEEKQEGNWVDAVQEVGKQLSKEKTDENTGDNADEQDNEEDSTMLTTVSFVSVDHTLLIDFSSSAGLSSAGLYHPYINAEDQDKAAQAFENTDFKPTYWAVDDHGVQFVQFEVGDGLLSVLASDNIWKNHHINEYDHAYLLTILAANSEQLVVLYGSLMPHIFVLIWKSAPELVLSSAILLALCLWFAGQRFGPILSYQSTRRRSFSEHLLASGEYFWRTQKQSKLLQRLREDVLKKIEKHTFSDITTDEKKVCEYLEQCAQFTKQQIYQALYEQALHKERDFTARVSLLQHLRQTL